MRLEGLSKLKIYSVTSTGLETATFGLVASCVNLQIIAFHRLNCLRPNDRAIKELEKVA
jgi:hypothetical protein